MTSRISKILVVRRAAFLSQTSTATFLVKGTPGHSCSCVSHSVKFSVLEYLSRDDADRAVKDLDGKDLRGRPVRVAYDDTVRIYFQLSFDSLISDVAARWGR